MQLFFRTEGQQTYLFLFLENIELKINTKILLGFFGCLIWLLVHHNYFKCIIKKYYITFCVSKY